MANGIVPENSKIDDDENMHEDIKAGPCKDYLKWKVLGKDRPDTETQVAGPGNALTFNGLFTVPEGVSISTCSALQVIAHHVVVGSVGVMSFPKVNPYSPLERVLEAFATAWADWERTILPSSLDNANNKKKEINVVRYAVGSDKIKNIRNLWCIPDDVNRDFSDSLADQPAAFWQEFYMQACQSSKESIVLELYPDYYFSEPMWSNKRKPYYSDGNIFGAVNAANEIRSQGRVNGQRPASIMFAGMNHETYERMAEIMQPPPPRPKFIEDLLSPEKLPKNVRENLGLESAVRRVPKIRRNINSILTNKNSSEKFREAGSDSEDNV
ncbi:hypothetical protein [Noviherbaspirillum soli]|uniref:hypothetical protein n=1 Tax=Noviherbaspirillum soli TaxID=1064518 RepID=UPI00188AE0D8|nr:hypothetical protein [Noviherbaspirillum soli]